MEAAAPRGDGNMLTKEQKDKITKAVAEAEKKTTGEFVSVIANRSDPYHLIPALWAALLALSLPALLEVTTRWLTMKEIYLAQIAAFAVLNLIFLIPPIKIRLIPRHIKKERAHKKAMEQFLLQGLSGTKERSGILLFVSLAEKYVEIIADRGINEKVAPGEWQKTIDQFVANVKKGHITEGFIQAIQSCTRILTLHFPGQKDDVNELSDMIVEIKE